MCIFSGPVEAVDGTMIFARGAGRYQYLVYSMSFAAIDDVAMVLPLPIPPGSPQDAVEFIDLERYAEFFDDLSMGFPARPAAALADVTADVAIALEVHEVGRFSASFVPRLADFERLDRRFQLPLSAWDSLPGYHDYGFAVFQLRGGKGSQHVHPMAFKFPRRDPSQLFFPTTHIHDGRLHPEAFFDHHLFLQLDASEESSVADWERARQPVEEFMNLNRTVGVVQRGQTCWRRLTLGNFENGDVIVGPTGRYPARIPPHVPLQEPFDQQAARLEAELRERLKAERERK